MKQRGKYCGNEVTGTVVSSSGIGNQRSPSWRTLIGTVVALASTRLLSRILYGVSAIDMSTFISAFCVLLWLVALATLMPAYRASRTSTVAALRHQ